MPTPELERLVRDTVGAVLGASVLSWPVDRPLAELPETIYDSLVQLEVLTRVERALRLVPRPVEPRELDTIAAIVAYAASADRLAPPQPADQSVVQPATQPAAVGRHG